MLYLRTKKIKVNKKYNIKKDVIYFRDTWCIQKVNLFKKNTYLFLAPGWVSELDSGHSCEIQFVECKDKATQFSVKDSAKFVIENIKKYPDKFILMSDCGKGYTGETLLF